MKLLSPQQVRDTKGVEQAREILRTKELNQASDLARKKLAQAESEFSQMLAGQQQRWAFEAKEHEKMVAEMTKEVEKLENRKQQALIPIEVYETEAKKRLQEAQEALRNAKKVESSNNDLQTLLEAKLDDVGAREQDVKGAEQRLLGREHNIKNQEEWTKRTTEKANETMVNALAYKAEVEKALSEREKKNILQERTLRAKEELLANTEKRLATIRKQLEDQRGVLRRAIIRNKEGRD